MNMLKPINSRKALSSIIILTLIFLNISCDQISKSLVREKVMYHQQINLAGERFILTKVENSGAFLSLGTSLSPALKQILLLGLPALALLVMFGLALLSKRFTVQQRFALAFIVGGGLGNIIDRFAYGSVTDFFLIDLGVVRTGIFNMADVSIMTGAIYLLFLAITNKNPKRPV